MTDEAKLAEILAYVSNPLCDPVNVNLNTLTCKHCGRTFWFEGYPRRQHCEVKKRAKLDAFPWLLDQLKERTAERDKLSKALEAEWPDLDADELNFTPEQAAEMEKEYAEFLERRNAPFVKIAKLEADLAEHSTWLSAIAKALHPHKTEIGWTYLPQQLAEMVTKLQADLDALKQLTDAQRAAMTRRTGSSSWEEFMGIWDPTEETAIDAIKRLSAELDVSRAREVRKKQDLMEIKEVNLAIYKQNEKLEAELATAKEEIGRLRKARWIDSSQQLPGEYQIVIVHGGIAQYRLGHFWTGMEDPRFGRRIEWDVTHWMPITAPRAALAQEPGEPTKEKE